MLREALDAFVAGDAGGAQAIIERDSKVDAYYAAIFREQRRTSSRMGAALPAAADSDASVRDVTSPRPRTSRS
jgi:phosphate uptake regulator